MVFEGLMSLHSLKGIIFISRWKWVKGDEVEKVIELMYIGIAFDNKLNFEPNTRATIKKSGLECIAIEHLDPPNLTRLFSLSSTMLVL